jgi:hypothetical protein
MKNYYKYSFNGYRSLNFNEGVCSFEGKFNIKEVEKYLEHDAEVLHPRITSYREIKETEFNSLTKQFWYIVGPLY